MLKAVPAQLFGVSLSSAKRNVRVAERGASITPKKGGDRPPKTDETTRKLLEEDVEERPAATVYERCRFLLIEAMGRALVTITPRDAKGFFEHCGYRSLGQPL
jgi:transposase